MMNDGDKIPTSINPPYDATRVYDLPMDEIFADSDFNVRGFIDPASVFELSKEIREHGTLLQPIAVQPYDKKPPFRYRILAGHRRHAAYKLLKWQVIPCLIKEGISQKDAWGINLRENIHRENLSVLQEARGIEHLKDMGVPQEEIARLVGKSRGWVQERVYLLDLPTDIQEEAARGNITLKQVRHIWSLQSTQQQREYVKSLKDAKIKGKVKEPKLEKFRRVNEKRLRTKAEIEAVQDIIRETFGNGIATRALGWVIGANSDLELHQFLADNARLNGKFYMIPPGLQGASKVIESPDDAVIKDDTEKVTVPLDDSDLEELLHEDPEDAKRGQ